MKNANFMWKFLQQFCLLFATNFHKIKRMPTFGKIFTKMKKLLRKQKLLAKQLKFLEVQQFSHKLSKPIRISISFVKIEIPTNNQNQSFEMFC
jgi:hypothetical protein